jgi:hypothetical protein
MAAAVHVVGGVDPHADTIHVAVLTAVGKSVGDAEFTTTTGGYARAVAFLTVGESRTLSGSRAPPVTAPGLPGLWLGPE